MNFDEFLVKFREEHPEIDEDELEFLALRAFKKFKKNQTSEKSVDDTFVEKKRFQRNISEPPSLRYSAKPKLPPQQSNARFSHKPAPPIPSVHHNARSFSDASSRFSSKAPTPSFKPRRPKSFATRFDPY